MRRLLIIALVPVLLFVGMINVSADSSEPSVERDALSELEDAINIDQMYDSLPYESRRSLERMGFKSGSVGSIEDVTFGSVMNELISVAVEQSGSALSSLGVMIAVILIYTLAENFITGMSSGILREVVSVVSALCTACVIVAPVTELISEASNIVVISSDLMISLVPVMVTVLVSAGQTVTGSEYYTIMLTAASGVSEICSKVVTPMLSALLGISVCTAIMPDMRFDGLMSFLYKTVKWLLSFSFTVFTAILSLKTVVSSSADNVSTRAVRYTVSSFVPVIGSALSEAYRTVSASVGVLKNGIGVFIIFAVGAVFLPLILRIFVWRFSVGAAGCFGEMIGLRVPADMLKNVSSVLGVLLSILLGVMALFMISTALLIMAGGAT